MYASLAPVYQSKQDHEKPLVVEDILTARWSPSVSSGAIHPSVPATPDFFENDTRPVASFLHRPKSEIMARTPPWEAGSDSKTFWGLMSLCTEHEQANDFYQFYKD
jgi:hypothetical protein